MDGAKSVTDTIDHSKECVIGRRFERVEASMQMGVDLLDTRILAVVRMKQS